MTIMSPTTATQATHATHTTAKAAGEAPRRAPMNDHAAFMARIVSSERERQEKAFTRLNEHIRTALCISSAMLKAPAPAREPNDDLESESAIEETKRTSWRSVSAAMRTQMQLRLHRTLGAIDEETCAIHDSQGEHLRMLEKEMARTHQCEQRQQQPRNVTKEEMEKMTKKKKKMMNMKTPQRTSRLGKLPTVDEDKEMEDDHAPSRPLPEVHAQPPSTNADKLVASVETSLDKTKARAATTEKSSITSAKFAGASGTPSLSPTSSPGSSPRSILTRAAETVPVSIPVPTPASEPSNADRLRALIASVEKVTSKKAEKTTTTVYQASVAVEIASGSALAAETVPVSVPEAVPAPVLSNADRLRALIASVEKVTSKKAEKTTTTADATAGRVEITSAASNEATPDHCITVDVSEENMVKKEVAAEKMYDQEFPPADTKKEMQQHQDQLDPVLEDQRHVESGTVDDRTQHPGDNADKLHALVEFVEISLAKMKARSATSSNDNSSSGGSGIAISEDLPARAASSLTSACAARVVSEPPPVAETASATSNGDQQAPTPSRSNADRLRILIASVEKVTLRGAEHSAS